MPLWLRSLIWVDSAEKYDAFLSYSWRSDSKVAPVIQSTIQKFLCPWYKTRARTVFRDLSCLPAGSNLEAELFSRLDRSTHLIVLASPEARTSGGMEIEAKHWFSRPREGEVLIIITSGDSETWAEIRDHLLPPAVGSNLTKPVWIPLQHRRDRILATPEEDQFREELFEDLKQILLRFYPGRDWGQLRGEERLQRQRFWRFMSGVITLLLLLLVTAVWQYRDAEAQRDRAERALRAATETADTLIFDMAQKFRDRGLPVQVTRSILDQAQKLQLQLIRSGETAAGLRRSNAAALDELVITLVAQGETAAALAAANRSLAIAKELVASNPGDADRQRDLSVSYSNVGAVLVAQGSLLDALKSYRDSLAIAQRLAQKDPGNAGWQRGPFRG